jgi:hypothetical protein
MSDLADLADPLLRRMPLPHRMMLPVMGIPVHYAASHAELLGAVEEVFGHWRALTPQPTAPAGARVAIRLVLHDGDEGDVPPVVTFRAADALRWMVHTRGSVGIVDMEHHTGAAWVTRALLNDRDYYRRAIVGFLTLMLATMHDRTPMHAAMVGQGDTGLLLAGPTGAGKSTLAYAAARAGLKFLSDDAVYIQRSPWRVWCGMPVSLLLDETARQFSELKGRSPSPLPGNKAKIVVPMASDVTETPWVTRAGVCLVERSTGPVRLQRADPAEIRAVLLRDHVEDRDRMGARLEEVAGWLSGRGGWRLTLSKDPADALPHLKAMLSQVEQEAAQRA